MLILCVIQSYIIVDYIFSFLCHIITGANLNHQDCMGKTPLIAALESGNHGIFQLLLRFGANPDILDHSFEFFF